MSENTATEKFRVHAHWKGVKRESPTTAWKVGNDEKMARGVGISDQPFLKINKHDSLWDVTRHGKSISLGSTFSLISAGRVHCRSQFLTKITTKHHYNLQMLGFVGTVAVAPPLHACVQPTLFHLTNLMRISSYLSLPLSRPFLVLHSSLLSLLWSYRHPGK